MKNMHRSLVIIILTSLLAANTNFSNAGNEDRVGQAGATELLINPWAGSSGWGGSGTACVRGLEAQFLNVAGIAFTNKTEVIFANTQWLKGTGVKINSFGFSQRLGEEAGVLALGIFSMSFGDIPITTVDNPGDGDIGTFSPNLMNINISYAKAFSNSIYGGINIKIINEAISDVTAQGIAIDAGIQYITGNLEQIKFGISLKNVGTPMKFQGDGLSFRGYIQEGDPNSLTVEQRSSLFELPSLINIGFGYDFFFGDDHTLTTAGNFTSNSFTKDQYSLGIQYAFKQYLQLRAGYTYEKGITEISERTSALTGPSAGFSISVPLNKENKSIMAIDYSFRATDPFQGCHSIGARISL